MIGTVEQKEKNSMETLIGQAQRMEPEAFDRIVDLYSVRLYSFLSRLTSNRDDAQELVQEVFVRVVRMIQHYEHDGRFDAWLFRIALNLARDRARKLTRAPGVTSLEAFTADADDDRSGRDRIADPAQPSPQDRARLDEDVDRMQQGMARLSEPEREVVLLRHYSQMSFADIAAMMETPIGTALARAHRALAKLREWMESQ